MESLASGVLLGQGRGHRKARGVDVEIGSGLRAVPLPDRPGDGEDPVRAEGDLGLLTAGAKPRSHRELAPHGRAVAPVEPHPHLAARRAGGRGEKLCQTTTKLPSRSMATEGPKSFSNLSSLTLNSGPTFSPALEKRWPKIERSRPPGNCVCQTTTKPPSASAATEGAYCVPRIVVLTMISWPIGTPRGEKRRASTSE